MSALSPAPAPALGVRWTDLPTPLDSTHPYCCLSYKQSTYLSPLCFHGLTNPFSRKSFPFISICVAPSCFPGSVQISDTPRPALGRQANPFNNLQPLFRSWFSFRSVCRLFSEAYSLFCRKQGGGWGVANLPKLALPSMRRLGVDPMLDMRLQEAQRDRALLQNGIVEGADVELAREAALGFGAQLSDLELAQLVGQRLPRPHDVAVDLDRDVLIGLTGVVLEKLDGLLARPVHRVHSGVDHQPHRAPHFVAELPELGIRIGVQPKILAKTLAVQRPAFHERGVADVPAKLRRVFHLLRQRNLQMVPRHSFMQRERFHLVLRPRVQIVRVHEVAARSASRRRSRLVISGRLRRRLEIRNGADAVRQARQLTEKMRQPRIDTLGNDAIAVHQILGLVIKNPDVIAQKFGEVVEASLKFRRPDDLIHLGANPFHLAKADFVNLLRRKVQRSLPANMKSVSRRAIRKSDSRNVLATSGKVSGSDVIVQLAKGRRNRTRVNALGFVGQPRAVSIREIRWEFTERLQQGTRERISGRQIRDLLRQVA